MDERECAERLAGWCDDLLGATSDLAPDDQLKRNYPFVSTIRLGPLPDAMVDLREKRIVYQDDRFPYEQLQQVMLRVFEAEISFMIERTDPDDDDDADQVDTQLLQEYGRRLEESLIADAQLGGRLTEQQMASPLVLFDYSAPFIEYPDGVKGRQLLLNIAVGEPAPHQQ